MAIEILYANRGPFVGNLPVNELPTDHALALLACRVAEISRRSSGTLEASNLLQDAPDARPLSLSRFLAFAVRDIIILREKADNQHVAFALEAGVFGPTQDPKLDVEALIEARNRGDFLKMRELLSNVKVFVAERPIGERYVPFWEAVKEALLSYPTCRGGGNK